MLDRRSIVLGVTGGIAAYKACEIVSRLTKRGADVRVVMTKNAMEFVAPLTFATVSGNPVYVDSFSPRCEMEHIALAKWADLMLIAPATANILGKITAGIADDLLSSVVMAMTSPVMLAPAMNTGMWNNPATVCNVETLMRRGYHFIGPERGRLACGDDDIGRMSEPEDIADAVRAFFARGRDWADLRVVVTAGPTVEDIDPVRYITNRSSGKMGYALAEAARDRGAAVTLITGPVSLKRPFGVDITGVRSTKDLYNALLTAAENADVVIQAAAPADYRMSEIFPEKLKRNGDALTLNLIPNPDIAQALGERKREGQVLVAFAAETGGLIENAREKMIRKNADLIVANDVTQIGAGFDADTNLVTLIDKDGEEALPLLTKREAADRILDKIAVLRKPMREA